MQPLITQSIPENVPAEAPLPLETAPAPAAPVDLAPKPARIVIEAGRSAAQYWRDLWRYRELLYFLAWRDIIVHYKQTLIGVAWALIKPLATMVVFVIVFSLLAGLKSGDIPYPLVVLAAMLPWQLFANGL